MPGRHAMRGRQNRRWPRRLAVLLVTFAILGGGAFFAQDLLSRDAEATCDGSHSVAIAAVPSIAPVLTDIVAEYEEDAALTIDGTCIAAEVIAVGSAELADSLNADAGPDLWVPESSMWMQRVSSSGVSLGEFASIATSPLVIVAPEAMAQQHLGWPDAEFSWAGVLGNEVPATIADPMTTSEGLATLLAVRGSVDEANQTQLVQAMTAVSESAVPDVAMAYERVVENPAAAPLFTAAEQSVVAHNHAHPASRVVALYPAEGTLAFDYPAIPLETETTSPTTRHAVARLIEAFQSETAVTSLQEAGFRSPTGAARSEAGIVDGIQAQMPIAMPSPDPEAATATLRQWAALSLDMRMLTVIDVSGSMWFSDDGGEKLRVDLVREAALVALNLLPETSHVGVWWFSTDEDPPNHWREIVPIRELREEVGDNTQLELLLAATDQLPDAEVRGWTALYDTAWAAFQEVKQNYDPNKINSVVLMTDGTDERAPDMAPGMDRETLLTQLRAQHDPGRPVPVITIGIGPDADMEALQQISEATGTRAYSAIDPTDIQEVFLQAMVERLCRPNC